MLLRLPYAGTNGAEGCCARYFARSLSSTGNAATGGVSALLAACSRNADESGSTAPSTLVSATPPLISASLRFPSPLRSRNVRMEAAPAVDRVGSGSPNRRAADSRWPTPCGVRPETTAPATSSQLRGRAGQPNALATWRRTASTTGDEARLSGSDGSMAAVFGWLDATASHIADSGTQTSARGSTVDCSQVEPSSATTTLGSLAT